MDPRMEVEDEQQLTEEELPLDQKSATDFQSTDTPQADDPLKQPVEQWDLDWLLKQPEAELRGFIREGSRIEKEEVSTKIAFGTTQERQLLPTSFPFTRMGAENYYRSRLLVGPGSYDTAYVTSSLYQQEKVASVNRKGFGFGNRTSPRIGKQALSIAPGPTKYQPDQSALRTFETSRFAFGSNSNRFKSIASLTPGPGTYDRWQEIGRRVQLPQSFGSKPFNPFDAIPRGPYVRDPQGYTTQATNSKEQKILLGKKLYLRLHYPENDY